MTHAAPLPMPEPDEAACDLAALEELTTDLGPVVVAELVALFVTETRARLRRIAEPTGVSTRLLREVHTLKGGAGIVAASRLNVLAHALEVRLLAGGAVCSRDIAALQAAFDAYADRARKIVDWMPAVPP